MTSAGEGDRNYSNGIAIISCSDLQHEEIALKIADVGNFEESRKITENVESYPWHIETKYYFTDVSLVCLRAKDLVNIEFANSIEAVLIHFDNSKVSSFQQAESWLPFVNKFNPEIKFLACNNCNDNCNPAVKRSNLMNWCLKNQFELVELFPDEDSDDDNEDDFKEAKGYKRIVEALHAHSWSNLTMKDPPVYRPSQQLLDCIQDEEENRTDAHPSGSGVSGNECASGISEKEMNHSEGRNPEAAKSDQISSLLDEDRWLFDAMGKEDPGSESFESLFERILNMKAKAETLSGMDRKIYAEKVAVEFWRAMGGDEEEIAGLSDSEN